MVKIKCFGVASIEKLISLIILKSITSPTDLLPIGPLSFAARNA